MNTITAFLQKMIKQVTNDRDSRIWDEWVKFKERKTDDIHGLIADENIRPFFKERVIFILLVPFKEWIPFLWKERREQVSDNRELSRINLQNLTPDLIQYTADLVILFYKAVIGLKDPHKYQQLLSFYNSYIVYLIPYLSKEKALELFSYFQLNDIVPFKGGEFSPSGYSFFDLLMHSDVDMRWKNIADSKMREIVLKEASSELQPREEWERAINCYARYLEKCLYGDSLPYDIDMYANQVEFVIDQNEKHCLFNEINLAKYFHLFVGNKYKDLRFKIAISLVSYNFSVYDKDTFECAKDILAEFAESEFAKFLRPKIDQYKMSLADKEKVTTAIAKEENAILAKMY